MCLIQRAMCKLLPFDCLISPRFPFKLLAVQAFTNKKHVVMKEEEMQITHPGNDIVLVGKRDPASKLFFLKTARELISLAQVYSGKPKQDTLWKLHLKHGHRNFTDVCRQYGLPAPKEPIPCASCIMGKSHLQAHKMDTYEKATRRAQGFHTDFKDACAQRSALPSHLD